jgi:hypothetical protein
LKGLNLGGDVKGVNIEEEELGSRRVGARGVGARGFGALQDHVQEVFCTLFGLILKCLNFLG